MTTNNHNQTELGKVEEAYFKADQARNRYLKTMGWQYTCKTPGSRWFWEKTLPDGRTVLCGPEDAMTIQENLE